METLTLANIAAHTAQIACVVALASAVSWLLRLDVAVVRYAYWRALFALCLLLPLLQGRQVQQADGNISVTMGVADFASVGPGDAAAAPLRMTLTSYVMPLLAAGVAVRLLWIAASLLRLRRLRRAGDRAPQSEIQDELQALIGTRCEVRYVERLRQPATFGLRRPVVLLPASLATSDPEMQRAVLSHELFHVKRRDWAWLLGEELVCAVLWFNPAVWWTVSRVHLAREAVVDELAVLATGRRRAYVEALIAFADETPLTPVAAFGSRRQLFNRIVWLSKEGVMSSRRLVFTCALMAAVVMTGSWRAVRAFPLTETPAAQAVQQTSPGPLEQRANAITAENPIPRRVMYEAPAFPVEARDAGARGSVTLMITLDEVGRIAEVRRLGLMVHSTTPPVSLTLRGGSNTEAEGKVQINGNAQQFDAIRAVAAALTDAAIRAVGQWRYDPPAVGPIAFPVTVNFSETRGATPAQGSAIKGPMWQPGSVSTDGAIRVGGNVKTPIKTRDVRPIYPVEAQAARASGTVILELRISREGFVEDASVIRSIPMLDQAAVDAVMQWRFTPTLLNGQPVPVIMTVTVNFVMEQQVLGRTLEQPREVAPEPQTRQLPALIKEVKPVYPPEALTAGVEGSVEVEVTIDTDGKVVNSRVTRSNPMLDDAAVTAAREWQFKPPAQPVVTTIEFTFSTRRPRGPE